MKQSKTTAEVIHDRGMWSAELRKDRVMIRRYDPKQKVWTSAGDAMWKDGRIQPAIALVGEPDVDDHVRETLEGSLQCAMDQHLWLPGTSRKEQYCSRCRTAAL